MTTRRPFAPFAEFDDMMKTAGRRVADVLRVRNAAPEMLSALKMAREVIVQDDCPAIYATVCRVIEAAEGSGK